MGTKSERTVPRLIKRLVQVKELAHGKTNLNAFSRFTLEDGCVWSVVQYALRMVRSDIRFRLHAGCNCVVSKDVKCLRGTRHRKVTGLFSAWQVSGKSSASGAWRPADGARLARTLGTFSGILAMLKNVIICMFLLSTFSPALAKTMTAVCGPFKGYTVGVSGSSERHKTLSYEDSMSGEFTLVWEIGSNNALIIGPGARPTREEAAVVISTNDQLSFVVTYPISVFVYSIFPERNTMLITKHTHSRGLEFDAARGFIMRSDCRLSIKQPS